VLKEDVPGLNGDVRGLKEDVQALKEDVGVLKENVYVLQGEMKEVKGELRLVQDNIYYMHVKMDKLETNFQLMNERMDKVEAEQHQLRMFQENILVPRLNNIEACYLSTYERYKRDSERMEKAIDDIDLLKRTVMSHSVKLQKLA
ncbi:MAG: hypothetical protein K2I53_06510, partial [Lachnospiraceae bacterium]|nr:hypothetical protein [Lachnospiraceae bacterium]